VVDQVRLLDMMSLKEIMTPYLDRIKSPFFGTFIIIWVVYNWVLFLKLYNISLDSTVEQQISSVRNAINEQTMCRLFWKPAGWTIVSLISFYFTNALGLMLKQSYNIHIKGISLELVEKGANTYPKEHVESIIKENNVIKEKLKGETDKNKDLHSRYEEEKKKLEEKEKEFGKLKEKENNWESEKQSFNDTIGVYKLNEKELNLKIEEQKQIVKKTEEELKVSKATILEKDATINNKRDIEKRNKEFSLVEVIYGSGKHKVSLLSRLDHYQRTFGSVVLQANWRLLDNKELKGLENELLFIYYDRNERKIRVAEENEFIFLQELSLEVIDISDISKFLKQSFSLKDVEINFYPELTESGCLGSIKIKKSIELKVWLEDGLWRLTLEPDKKSGQLNFLMISQLKQGNPNITGNQEEGFELLVVESTKPLQEFIEKLKVTIQKIELAIPPFI
jgi:hypothetical protein